jgi:hypothetical protein
MKNPHFLGWSPMFHWTDSKIRVHAFYCGRPGEKHPRIATCLSERDPDQDRLMQTLGLDRYLPSQDR